MRKRNTVPKIVRGIDGSQAIAPITAGVLLLLVTLAIAGCKPSSLLPGGSKEKSQQGQAATPQQPQASASRPEPASLLGLDPYQVTAALGEASGQLGSSTMLIWYYPDYEIRFANGKVVQARPRSVRSTAPSPLSQPPMASARQVAPRPAASSSNVASVETIRGKGARVSVKDIAPRGKVTIVDFFADWCGPCKKISPSLEALAKSDPDVVLRKVDIVNWETPVVKQYGIRSVPNIRVYNASGRQIGQPTSSFSQVKAYVAKAKK